MSAPPIGGQFLPPGITSKAPEESSPAPLAASGPLQPGVGFRILPGAMSSWQASPNPAARSGSAPFDLSSDPFPPNGVGNVSDQASFVRRYLGGDAANFGARPGSGGAEGAFIYAGPALAQAFKTQATLPGGSEWVPGNWDGNPNDRERTDLEFLQGSDQWIRATWEPVESVGTTPDNPLAVTATSCDIWRSEPFVYFVTAHLKTRKPLYWQQTVCRPGEISYSPARRDPDTGVQVPAYPQIFGAPTKPGPKPEPRPDPEPEPDPEPKPQPTDPECPGKLAKALQDAEALRTMLSAAEAENARLAGELGEAANRLLDCQRERDRLGAEVDSLKDKLARTEALVPVVVPPFVSGTLKMLSELSGLVNFGGQRKQRVQRLITWVQELSRRSA